MALQSFTLDPAAGPQPTPDEAVELINLATANITRAGSVEPTARPIETGEVGSDEIEDGAVTAVDMAANAARDNLFALPPVDRRFVCTNPGSGDFKVTGLKRRSDGLFEVEYDDVPEP